MKGLQKKGRKVSNLQAIWKNRLGQNSEFFFILPKLYLMFWSLWSSAQLMLPRYPIILSENERGVQSSPQQKHWRSTTILRNWFDP